MARVSCQSAGGVELGALADADGRALVLGILALTAWGMTQLAAQRISGAGPSRLMDEMARYLAEFVSEYGVGIVGGCCGTRPAHTAKMRAMLDGV